MLCRYFKLYKRFLNLHVSWICNATNKHEQALLEILNANYEGKILIEKPLSISQSILEKKNIKNILVSFNLRFHPLIKILKEELENEEIIQVCSYVGQYLPEWRPGRDYREVYSAKRSEGGGVLRDLSHEIDFLAYLTGQITHVSAFGGKLSALENRQR